MVLVKIKLPQSVLSIDKAAKARAAQNISSELDSTMSNTTIQTATLESNSQNPKSSENITHLQILDIRHQSLASRHEAVEQPPPPPPLPSSPHQDTRVFEVAKAPRLVPKVTDEERNDFDEVPESRQKKKIFTSMIVETVSMTAEEYDAKFECVAEKLKAVIDENPDLRGCLTPSGIRKSMVGTTAETAVPSIVIYCRKRDKKALRAYLKSKATDRIYCRKNSLVDKMFGPRQRANGAFRLVYWPYDRESFLDRKTACSLLAGYDGNDATFCASVLQYKGRTATVGVALELDNSFRLLTVHHLYGDSLETENDPNADTSAPSWDILNEMDEDAVRVGPMWIDDESEDDDEIDAALPGISTEPPQNQSDGITVSEHPGSELGKLACRRVAPVSKPATDDAFLDWELVEVVSTIPSVQDRYPNAIYPSGRSGSFTYLRNIAEAPRTHKARVFMVSGVRSVQAGHILRGFSYLGSRPGQKMCRVWTVRLDGKNGLQAGECGSLIVDQETLQIYGHVVGDDITRQVSVVPLIETIEQIKRRFKCRTVRLPLPRTYVEGRFWQIRKPALWVQNLRNSDAVQYLRDGRYDLLPVDHLRGLTDRLVLGSSKILSYPDESDMRLTRAIDKVREQWPVRALAIIASLHAFTPAAARRHVASTMVEPELSYLQCIIVGHRIRPTVFDENEDRIANVLLGIVMRRNQHEHAYLWTILRRTKRDGVASDNLFPPQFIIEVLSKYGFIESFRSTLEGHMENMRWIEIRKLLYGLQDAWEDPGCQKIIRECLAVKDSLQPEDWVSWNPSIKRIQHWSKPIVSQLCKELAPLLELEGPDLTHQQGSTLKDSDPGYFTSLAQYGRSYTRAIIEKALRILDSSIYRGSASIRLVAQVFLATRSLDHQKIGVLQAIFALNSEPFSHVMGDYLKEREVDKTDRNIHALCVSTAGILPFISKSNKLQAHFRHELSNQAPMVLTEAQKKLIFSMMSPGPGSQDLAVAISDLAKAMLDATWLCRGLKDDYLQALQCMPTKTEILRTFGEFEHAFSPTERAANKYLILEKVAFVRSRHAGRPSLVQRPGADLEPQWDMLKMLKTPGRRSSIETATTESSLGTETTDIDWEVESTGTDLTEISMPGNCSPPLAPFQADDHVDVPSSSLSG